MGKAVSGRRTGSRRPAQKKASATEQPPGNKKRRSTRNRLTLVRRLIDKVNAELDSDGVSKSGVAELVRLLALEKEMTGQETVREIKVTWVDQNTVESSKSE